MESARARRHYRVAQREVAQSPAKGVFMTYEWRNRLIILAVLIWLVSFVKGILFGYLIRKNWCD